VRDTLALVEVPKTVQSRPHETNFLGQAGTPLHAAWSIVTVARRRPVRDQNVTVWDPIHEGLQLLLGAWLERPIRRVTAIGSG
jgi:hypothetical protein